MSDELFLQEVKRYVREVDPQAEVWLFGPRPRAEQPHFGLGFSGANRANGQTKFQLYALRPFA